MYIVAVPNRHSPPAILLRESYRENGKVKNRTLANISSWPPERIEAFRRVLRDEPSAATRLADAFEIVDSRPHGHVAAVLGTMRRLDVPTLLADEDDSRAFAEAMVASRLLHARSKLGLCRDLNSETQTSSLGECLHLDAVVEKQLYAAMDRLLVRQPAIEQALAERHLTDGGIALFDVSSTYFEGRTCPLAKIGYSRDGKRNSLQIVFGLLTNAEGCPVAVEVFEGNVGDPMTLPAQVKKLRERFGIQRVVLVGDRGMITDARIREDLADVEGLAWITSLRAPAIQALVERGSLQLSLFDEVDLAEISDPQYRDERLIVCKNPLLADERARKRSELIDATEKQLGKIAAAVRRPKNPLRGAAKIGLRVGKVLERYNVQKHFILSIADDQFEFRRDEQRIAEEAALDGIYVVRTSVSAENLGAEAAVRAYKSLAVVERAFRSLKSLEDIAVRPIFHRKPERVRAHVFICMLAYYVEWHMRQALAPLLFQDDDKRAAKRRRRSVVQPARRSVRAERKAETKRNHDGEPVYSFRSLLDHLATLTRNRVQPKIKGAPSFISLARPTPTQERAFELLGTQANL